MSVRLVELELGGDPGPWGRLGFTVGESGLRIGSVLLRFVGGEPAGIARWSLSGAPKGDLDGLPTRIVAESKPEEPAPEHPNGARQLDHVVVLTPDLDRTFAALERASFDLRRVRDAGTEEHPVRQGFYRLGEVILEVVGDVEPPGPARFWGLVVVAEDLDALSRRVGDDLGSVREAVQSGRRIATVRESAGLGVPVAFMTPAPARG